MRSAILSRKNLSRWSVIGILLAGGLCLAAPFPPDPVDELKSELRLSLDDLRYRFPDVARSLQGASPEKEIELFNRKRESILMERIDALRTIPEKRRALLLNEWRVVERRDEMAVVDRKVRRVLAERFEKQVRQVLQHGNVTEQLAVINTIAEVGPTALAPEDKAGIGRDFGADLAELMKKGHPAMVRATAARAMGQIFPDPQLAAKALGDLLTTGNVEERRGAAAGLLGMVRVPLQLITNSDTVGKVQLKDEVGSVDRKPLAVAVKTALSVAGKGLSDPDLPTARLCAEAFQQASVALTDPNIVPQRAGDEPRGRRFAGPEALQAAAADLNPLIDTFRAQAPNLAKALVRDDDQIVALFAKTIENIAIAKELFARGSGDLPAVKPPASGTGMDSKDKSNGKVRPAATDQVPPATRVDPLVEIVRTTVTALAQATTHPSAQVRLRAIEAIETIGPQAEAAVPALLKSLKDKDLFVRWAAARALGKVGANESEQVVPGLAKLLDDQDYDVNIAAARALQRFGPEARAALPKLEHALTATDAGKRTEVLRTIESIGTGASPAIAAVTAALEDPDPPNRRLAAELLGRFGRAAASAQPALRRLLNDPDPDVRRAASDALLNIEER